MPSTRRDVSGVFDTELRGSQETQKAAILDQSFHVNRKGITFVSDKPLTEWSEVGVQMKVPRRGAQRDQAIACRAVVVQCSPRTRNKGFEVALLFLDLPRRAQTSLDVLPAAHSPLSISISR